MTTSHSTHADPKVIALVIVVIIGWIMVKSGGSLLKYVAKQVLKDGIAILVIRHFSGAHYHGRKPTNATWWQPGSTTSRQYNHDSWLSRWEHKPQGHRALWRTGCTFAFFGICYGLLAARAVTLHALESLAVYGIFALGFVIESKIKLRVHNRHVLNPTVKSLAVILRTSEHSVRRQLHIKPENIRDEGEVGYFELLPEQTPGGDQVTSIARVVDAHLPVDIEAEPKFQQAPKIIVFRAGLKPPAEVTLESMLPLMEACPKGDVILGKDRFKEPYQATFTGLDDPHWGFCVQSGSGKSNFLGIVCAQILHQDPQNTVSVIDPKRVSLIDFLGSPGTGIGHKPLINGVKMANNPLRPQAMRDLIQDTYDLMERRALEAEANRGTKFDVHLLVIDELNMFTDIMSTFWGEELAENKATRAQDKTIPELPRLDPMWGQIRAILRMGRFTNIHMVVVAQDLRDEAFGGKGARNYLGFRGLGSYNKKQWDMLIGPDYQLPQKGIGRWIFINKGEKTWVQITRGDEHEDYSAIYAFASQGREEHDERAALALGLVPAAVSVGRAGDPEFTASSLTGSTTDTAVDTRRTVIGLREAASYLGMSHRAFEQARRRTESDGVKNTIPGEFRQGASPAWYADDLDAWWRDRPGNKRRRGHLRVVDEG